MFYLSFSATIFGLLISAFFESTEEVMSIVPIALIPQILLAGVIAKMDATWKCVLSCFMLGRWGTEGFCHLQDDMGVNTEGVSDSLGVNIPYMPIPSIPPDTSAINETTYGAGNAVNHLGFYTNIKDWPLDFIEPTWSDSCLLYTSPSPRDQRGSRMPSSA